MKLLYSLLCVSYVSCYFTDTIPSSKETIVGGEIAAIRDEYYYAALYHLEKFFCGSVIISQDWLLTAEKCFIGVHDVQKTVKVVTGIMYDNHGPVSSFTSVQSVIRYSEDYPDSDVTTNLALILLAESIIFNDLQKAITIANSNEDPVPGSVIKLTGFGKTGMFKPYTSNWLRKATQKVLRRQECHAPDDRFFCAKVYLKDACFGDEGGPGVINNVLVAIITGTPNCEYGSLPAVYTKVGTFYYWIIRTTNLSYNN